MKKRSFASAVKSTALITSLATVSLAALYRYLPEDWVLSAAISFGTTAYHFLMRLAVGYAVLYATKNQFDHRRPWFRPKRWETAFYRKLHVKNWKGQLPTYAPNQFSMETNTLLQVIQNTCGAEVVHEIIIVFSFAPLATVPLFGALPVFLITSVLAALFDSIFVIAQRYNRPRLVRIYEKQEARSHE